VPTPEFSVPTPEFSVPTPEFSVPTPEFSVPINFSEPGSTQRISNPYIRTYCPSYYQSSEPSNIDLLLKIDKYAPVYKKKTEEWYSILDIIKKKQRHITSEPIRNEWRIHYLMKELSEDQYCSKLYDIYKDSEKKQDEQERLSAYLELSCYFLTKLDIYLDNYLVNKDNILTLFETEEEMNDKEKELVVVSEESYNLCEGGKGGWGYVNLNKLGVSNNQKEAARKFIIEKKIYSKGGTSSLRKQYKLKIGWFDPNRKNGFLNKKHSDEWKKQQSEIMKRKQLGKNNLVASQKYSSLFCSVLDQIGSALDSRYVNVVIYCE
jgi:hypothetical protein